MAWFFIYRTDGYNKLKNAVDRINKKLAKKKETPANATNQKSHNRKVKSLEDELQSTSRSIAMHKLKSDIIIFMGFTLVFISTLSTVFDGKAVAKLPFEPISLIRGVSHRNLRGEDYTECSMIFLYILCSVSIRANLQKIFGTTPPPTPSFFAAAQG